MGLLNKLLTRQTCDHVHEQYGKTVSCQEYAQVTVDGTAYCQQHRKEIEWTDN